MLTQDRYQTILIEKRASGVAIVTFNRPEKLNAINARMHTELTTLTLDAEDDPDVKVLLVTGAGRAFCAGGDAAVSRLSGHWRRTDDAEARQIVDNLLDCSKPVISAVNGYAMGLGANFALLSDVVVAARGATFADTHVRMGIGAGDGGQVIWPLLMGVNRAKYFLMTGDASQRKRRTAGAGQFRRRRRGAHVEGPGHCRASCPRSGPRDRGLQGSHQQVHQDGFESGPAALAQPRGSHHGDRRRREAPRPSERNASRSSRAVMDLEGVNFCDGPSLSVSGLSF